MKQHCGSSGRGDGNNTVMDKKGKRNLREEVNAEGIGHKVKKGRRLSQRV